MAARVCLAGLSLIVLGCGLYGTWFRWESTRVWRPLDVPVSLSPGHIRIPEFRINKRSRYAIAFLARGAKHPFAANVHIGVSYTDGWIPECSGVSGEESEESAVVDSSS